MIGILHGRIFAWPTATSIREPRRTVTEERHGFPGALRALAGESEGA